MAASKSIVLTFEIFRGEDFIRRQELKEESVTIGRGPAAMLRVEEGNLQDLQAVLNVNDDGTVQLLDLVGDGSTMVNGQPVSNVLLSTGDKLGFADLQIVVRITDAAAFADDEATRVDAPPPVAAPVRADVSAQIADRFAEASGAAGEEALAEGQEYDDEAPTEDVVSFVMRASATANDASADRSRGRVLEVAQVFGDAVLETRLFAKGSRVRVGSSTATTIRFMGFPVAVAAPGAANIIGYLPLIQAH